MKTQEELFNIISANTDLITKAFAEAGDELSYDKITSFTGTPQEKYDALQAKINERAEAQKEYDAEEAKLANLAEQKKENARIEKAIKTPVNRPVLNNGLENKNIDREEDYTSKFFVPAEARTSKAKICKNDREAYAMGMWAVATFGNESMGTYEKAREFVKENFSRKALSPYSNATGGALVPTEFSSTLIDLKEKYGVFRRNTKVVPMSSDTLVVPRRNAHTSAYYITANNAPTESAPTFNNVQLVTKKLASLIAIPNELMEDALINLGDWIMEDFAWNFSYQEDLAGFIGDGTDTYGGIVGVTNALKNLSGTIANIAGLQVATGTGYGTNYNSIVLTDFEGVLGRMPQYAVAGAKWYFSEFFYWNVAKKLAYAAGGVPATEIINGVPQERFLGYPVEVTQVMPAVSAVDQVCAIFGNLPMGSLLGDRRMFNARVSTEGTFFTNDQTGIMATQRFDINVHDVGNASATAGLRVAGPICGLITAAS